MPIRLCKCLFDTQLCCNISEVQKSLNFRILSKPCKPTITHSLSWRPGHAVNTMNTDSNDKYLSDTRNETIPKGNT